MWELLAIEKLNSIIIRTENLKFSVFDFSDTDIISDLDSDDDSWIALKRKWQNASKNDNARNAKRRRVGEGGGRGKKQKSDFEHAKLAKLK